MKGKISSWNSPVWTFEKMLWILDLERSKCFMPLNSVALDYCLYSLRLRIKQSSSTSLDYDLGINFFLFSEAAGEEFCDLAIAPRVLRRISGFRANRWSSDYYSGERRVGDRRRLDYTCERRGAGSFFCDYWLMVRTLGDFSASWWFDCVLGYFSSSLSSA